MSAEKPLPLLVSGRPLPRWRHGLMFLGSMAAVAVVVGLLAAWLQQYFAPFLLFPMLIGLLLGLLLDGRMSKWEIGHRPLVLSTAMLTGLLTVLVIHYTSYRIELAAAADRPPEHDLIVQAFPDLEASGHGTPESFVDYMRLRSRVGRELGSWRTRDALLWVWWGIDAALIAAIVVQMAARRLQRPFCRQCHAWYRPIRRVAIARGAADALADRLSMRRDEGDNVFCVVISCPGGCGAARLTLIWNQHSAQHAWLDSEALRQAMSTLDAAKRVP